MVADLPAWRCGETAVPLRAWRAGELAALAGTLALALQAWERDWGLPGLPDSVHCAAAEDLATAAEWLLLGSVGPAAAWVALEPAFEEELSGQLWGMAPTTSPIACEVQARCRDDLQDRLAHALGIARDSSGPACRGRAPVLAWSGSVDASLARGVRLRLDGQIACNVLRAGRDPLVPATDESSARLPLTPVDQAVAASSLTLRVHLADCELAVGSLQDLQIGDVVRVKHAVDAPLQVRDPHGHAVFCGFLARCRGFKALELATHAPAGAHSPGKVLP